MNNLVSLVGLTLIAGLAMPLGAFLASFGKLKSQYFEAELSHSLMAFGGGALLSAVALVLVPYGITRLEPLIAIFCLIGGGMIFMVLDIYLVKFKTPGSQLVAMILDFIPESIALGTAFAIGSKDAVLLAALITLQNIPEGFNAFRELNMSSGFGPKKIIASFFLMAFLGPVSGVSSYLWLQDQSIAIAVIVLVASGGILYSIFQDIAPRVKLEKHWVPPMGAVLGFSLGMVGVMVIK
ncbi:ZIP family metal transporter [Solemya velum gill symbiont]|uniref:ZIP family metal transporter n=1 Tax=Solemya velum gill symbiont TaxID=2340 RepID=UPI0009986706|nr:divalent cation transporter [Solemya velum gill symbiont]OOZ45403.1 divalent cation transporter [Solemya velum gill symbiont]OOZ47047.1 divalent cation transporter [Solemya velum gill symbiont]OOZ52147.1 divalent cation transporter [Solemya velum gill symbiont]OOZ54988.1 divalent cation transporter [Solemya velum gill symbiont]OOZ56663.1 divalent cation transporter [Solemya velum gill symbiont]